MLKDELEQLGDIQNKKILVVSHWCVMNSFFAKGIDITNDLVVDGLNAMNC